MRRQGPPSPPAPAPHISSCRRGSLVIRQLCMLMDAELVYCQLASILEQEGDYEFATVMVQVGLRAL